MSASEPWVCLVRESGAKMRILVQILRLLQGEHPFDRMEDLGWAIGWLLALGAPILLGILASRLSASRRGDKAEPNSQDVILGGIVGWGVAVGLTWLGWTPSEFAWLIWLGAIILGIATAVAGAAAMADSTKIEDKQALWGIAGFCGIACVISWVASNSQRMDIPKLPKKATAEEITTAYRERCYHIGVTYTSTVIRKGFLFDSRETAASGASGSGVLIANDTSHGLIVTNRHVVDPGYSGEEFGDLRVYVKSAAQADVMLARIAAVHSRLDLALVIVDASFPRRGAIRLMREATIRQGEPAVAIGNPLGLEFIVSEGIISGRSGGMLTTTSPISPGNSGGPLFLARRGRLAGINTSSATDGQNVNLAVPAESILQSFKEEGEWIWVCDQGIVEQLSRCVPLEDS